MVSLACQPVSIGVLLSRGGLSLLLRRPCRPAAAFRRPVPRPRLLRLGGAEPVRTVVRRAPEDPFEYILPVLHHLRARAAAFGPDLQLAQAGEHGLHRLVGIDEELAAAHAHEAPAEPLENGLPRHVLAELLDGCRLVALALDRQAAPSGLDDQLAGVVADPPVWQDSITGLEQAVVDLVLQRRLGG